jgi:hypothetical protein
MRAVVVMVLLATATVSVARATADEQSLCEEQWPKTKHPRADVTNECIGYWSSVHHTKDFVEEGVIGVLNDEVLTQIPSEDFDAMADHASAVCPDAHGQHEFEDACLAREFFTSASEARTDHRDPNEEPLDDVIAKVFRGEELTVDDIAFMAPVSLWKLRNAPYARHGQIFKTADLNTFFGGVSGYAPSKSFNEKMLDRHDEKNVALVADAQSGALPIAHMSRYGYCQGKAKCCTWGNPSATCAVDRDALRPTCEGAWPQGNIDDDPSEACDGYYAGSSMNDDIVWELDAKTERALADKIGQGAGADFLRAAADSHFSLVDPVTNASFEPLLRAMLDGKRVAVADLKPLAAVTLWRLRNAPFARHGRPFKTVDLETFFYAQLKLVENAKYDDKLLDKNDQANVDAVMAEIHRRTP